MPSEPSLKFSDIREAQKELERLWLKELMELSDWIINRAAKTAQTAPLNIRNRLKAHPDLLKQYRKFQELKEV